jgi:hypothetical protein
MAVPTKITVTLKKIFNPVSFLKQPNSVKNNLKSDSTLQF